MAGLRHMHVIRRTELFNGSRKSIIRGRSQSLLTRSTYLNFSDCNFFGRLMRTSEYKSLG